MSIEENVKQWLSEEDFIREVRYDENADFHFIIEFPKDNIMEVIKPKGKDFILIACATKVAQEHLNLMNNADALTKKDFIMALNFSLNSYLVDFEFRVVQDILQQFVVTDQIFEDGLTKHELIKTIKRVFKAKLQCVWLIDQKFTRPNITGTSSNENDMFI